MPEMTRNREVERLSPARAGSFTVSLAISVIAAVLLLRSPADGQPPPPPCTATAGTMQGYFCDALLLRKRIRIDGKEFRMTAVHDDHFVVSTARRQGAGDSVPIPMPVPYTAVRDVEVWGGMLNVRR